MSARSDQMYFFFLQEAAETSGESFWLLLAAALLKSLWILPDLHCARELGDVRDDADERFVCGVFEAPSRWLD